METLRNISNAFRTRIESLRDFHEIIADQALPDTIFSRDPKTLYRLQKKRKES
jgi:cell division protein FtsB